MNNELEILRDTTHPKYKELLQNIKQKISSYKSHDKKKMIYSEYNYVTPLYILNLIVQSQLKCKYCNKNIVCFYSQVRQKNQWSLDRINNFYGHVEGNVNITCLECNLKKKRTNTHIFAQTRNVCIEKIKN